MTGSNYSTGLGQVYDYQVWTPRLYGSVMTRTLACKLREPQKQALVSLASGCFRQPPTLARFCRASDSFFYYPNILPKPPFPCPFDSPLSLYGLYYRRVLDLHVEVDISASPSWVKAGLHEVGCKVSALSECIWEFRKIVFFFGGCQK